MTEQPLLWVVEVAADVSMFLPLEDKYTKFGSLEKYF
jgi:hypothetical protein